MPFDANGNFKRNYCWEDDRDANIAIKAQRHDADHDDFAAGLSECVTRDGTGKFTADVPANGHRVVDLADGVKKSDGATVGQVQRGFDYAEDTSDDEHSIVIRLSPALTAYAAGQGFAFKLKCDKSAPLSFKADALEECSVKIQGEDPLLGALKGGVIYEARYDYDAQNQKRIVHITSMASTGNGIHVGVPFLYAFKGDVNGARPLDGTSIIYKANRYYQDFYNLVWQQGVRCTFAEYEQELKDHFGNCGKFGYEVDGDGDINIKLPCIKDHVRGISGIADLSKAVNDQTQDFKAVFEFSKTMMLGASAAGAGAVKKAWDGYHGLDSNGQEHVTELEIRPSLDDKMRTGDYTEVRGVQYRWMMQVSNAVAAQSFINVDNVAADMANKLETQDIVTGEGLEKTTSGRTVTLRAKSLLNADGMTITKSSAGVLSAVALQTNVGPVTHVYLTQAEYDALSPEDQIKEGVEYNIFADEVTA